MSIDVTIRPQGATSGGESRTIEGEGAIDTRQEAEAALALLGPGYTTQIGGETAVLDRVAYVGNELYDRSRLVSIRDGQGSAAPTTTTIGTGISHNISLQGSYTGGLDSIGHSGGGARLSYSAGIPFTSGAHRFFVDPSLGVGVTALAANYTIPESPGGEMARPGHSGFTSYGAVLGADIRYMPPVPNYRLNVSLGANLGIGGFSTPESGTIARSCMPGDMGRGECEPVAGPGLIPDGADGLYQPNLHYSRPSSGLAVQIGFPLSVGVVLTRGSWGNISAFATFEPAYTILSPGFSFWNLSGAAGITVAIGGSAAAAPTQSAPQAEQATLAEQPAAGEVWNLDPILQAQLPAGAHVQSVAFDGNNLSGPPYSVPAASMTAGSHTLRITYRMPGETEDRVRELAITVAQPVNPGDGGFVGIEHNETIER